MAFITGQRVVAVMAEFATFIGARREPSGPVETFSTEVATETVSREIATEDAAVILLRFENGARGAVSISQISAGRKNSLQYEIDGSRSSVAWDSEQPDQIWFGHRELPNEVLLKNPALMGPAGRAAAALPGGHVEGFADTFSAVFRAIYADVAAGRPAEHPRYATFADGHDEMLVNASIARSAREGRWVDVAREGRTPTRSSSTPPMTQQVVAGRLVLDDRVEAGAITVEDERIVGVERAARPPTARTSRPGSSTSTCTAGAGTTPWAISRPSTGWPGDSCGGASRPSSRRP